MGVFVSAPSGDPALLNFFDECRNSCLEKCCSVSVFLSCSMLMIAVVGMPRGSRYHRVPELDKICFISLLTPCSVWELSLCYDSEKCSTIHACLIVER
ncbi:hypothetical protein WN943_000241 [Citrus x changshan-huyou]